MIIHQSNDSNHTENMEIPNNLHHPIIFSKEQQFIICDKLLGSYIQCINVFSDKNSDCSTIYNSLSKVEICKFIKK
jgi:hypothetical protein